MSMRQKGMIVVAASVLVFVVVGIIQISGGRSQSSVQVIPEATAEIVRIGNATCAVDLAIGEEFGLKSPYTGAFIDMHVTDVVDDTVWLQDIPYGLKYNDHIIRGFLVEENVYWMDLGYVEGYNERTKTATLCIWDEPMQIDAPQ